MKVFYIFNISLFMKKWIFLLILIPCVLASPNVYKFGEDYWFENENTIKTDTGWVYNIEDLMDYTVEGEVMGVRFYKEDKAPFGLVDVALAWGDILKPEIKENLEVTMEYRYCSYYYTCENSEISFYYLRTHMSNNHLIPASEDIFNKIIKIKKGDYIKISGTLVYIKGEKRENNKIERMEWGPSSTTLEDEGDKACEIILVKSLEFVTQEPSISETPNPLKNFEEFYKNVWKSFVIIFIVVFLILYIPSKLLSRKKEKVSPRYDIAANMIEYYTKKGYRVLKYNFNDPFLKIAISKNEKIYLATIDLKTGKISYRLIR
ncbi:hypothetical protein DRN45_04840 [Thermococci archaeon]|nr:MAG: hypothetical protein DRN45_04840 [Thermococci archaeon]